MLPDELHLCSRCGLGGVTSSVPKPYEIVRDQSVAHRLDRFGLDQFFCALKRADAMQAGPKNSGAMMPLAFLASWENRRQGPFHQTEKLPNFLAMPLGKLPAVGNMVLE